jgi:hypothetical protein
MSALYGAFHENSSRNRANITGSIDEKSVFQSLNPNGDEIMKNSSNIMKIVLCALLLSFVIGCAGTPTRESTGQYIDDSAITAKVKAAIFAEESLKTLQITVVTFKGTVQLSGFVDTPEHAVKAGRVARNVEGVRAIKNDLLVK